MPVAVPRRDLRTRVASDGGWVIVPVIVLMVVALGLGFALLAIVDTQTSEGRQQRDVNAAQTLAEGVVAAASTVLGSDSAATTWPVSGTCRTYSHRLSETTTGSDLESRITKAVHDRFSGTSTDLTDVDTAATSWSVSLCPVQGTATTTGFWDQTAESAWSPTFLSRTATVPAGTGPAQVSMWVRGQANVRSAATPTGTRPRKSRAVVTKIRQDAAPFSPPTGLALGAGSISTDVGSSLSSTLLNNTSLTGRLLGSTLGTKPLIGNSPAKIGTRCGLLNALNQLNSVCLSGTLAGAGGATSSLSLGALNTVLGIDSQTTLATWTMASPDAMAAYRQDAIRTGIYKATAPGLGDDKTKTSPVPSPSGSADCIPASELAASTGDKVIFIDKVGNGDQYCTLPGGVAKIFVVARGAVRITKKFTGVVYALNQQECAATTGVCTDTDRKNAIRREVVRVEGNSGQVVGSVWADGAGGQVGVYPSLASPDSGALLQVGDAQTGICGVPVLGPVLTGLSSTLGGVLGAVGNLLGAVAGGQEQVRYVDAQGNVLDNPPSDCQFLRNTLGALTSSSLLDLFGTGGTQSTVLTQHRTRKCVLLICGDWSDWTARDSVSFSVPALLTSGVPSVVGDVVGLLTSTLTNYQAITYDESVTKKARTAVTQGAGPVPGSFRSVATTGGF